MVAPRVTNRRRAPALTPRLAWSHARRHPSRLLSAAASLGLFAVAVWLVVSPSQRVSGAVISGNIRLGNGALYAASGLEGRHVLTVDPRVAEAAVEALPEVRRAWVSLAVPARAEIRVEETQPLLLISGISGAMAVDEVGTVMPPPADPARLAALIPVRLASGEPPAVGSSIGPERVAAALALSKRFERLVWDDEHGYVAATEDGWELRLGQDPALVSRQLAVLDALSQRLAPWSDAVEMVDLRYPTRPYYRIRGEENGS